MEPSFESTKMGCPTCGISFEIRTEADAHVYECPRCGMKLRVLNPPSSRSTLPPAPSEVSEASRDPKKRFGKFILLSEAGSGGMGAVWKAWQSDLGRFVALKFMHSEHPDDVQRFLREAQTSAGLTHPNIVPVYEAGETEGRHFVAMEFIEGQTLDRVRFAPRQAAEAMKSVAEAVHFAHERGIIHRDLKPQNLMMDAGGVVRVMDFGLAKTVREGATLTLSGATVGTPAYMSPEQAQGRKCDARSDVWSLGATLYELLTGHPPFEGSMYLEIMQRVCREDPKPPRKVNSKIHPELETIVLKALEKDPDRRYASAREFAEDLRRHLQGELILARPASMIVRTGKWTRRHRLLVTVGVLILMAVTGTAFLLLRQARYAEAMAALTGIDGKVREINEGGKLEIEALKKTAQRLVDAASREIDRIPSEPFGYVVRARARRYLAQDKEILEDLDRAIALDPKSPVANAESALCKQFLSYYYELLRSSTLTPSPQSTQLIQKSDLLKSQILEHLRYAETQGEGGAAETDLSRYCSALKRYLLLIENRPNPDVEKLLAFSDELQTRIDRGGNTAHWINLYRLTREGLHAYGRKPFLMQECRQLLDQVQDDAPNDPFVLFMVAYERTRPFARDLDSAIKGFTGLFDRYPYWQSNQQAKVITAHSYHLLGNLRAAEETIKTIYTEDSSHISTLAAAGDIFLARRNLREALRCFQKIIDITRPETPWYALMRLGDVRYHLRDPRALQNYRESGVVLKQSQGNFNDGAMLYGSARWWLREGDKEKALEFVLQAEGVEDKYSITRNAAFLYTEGEVRRSLGQAEDARRAYSKAIELRKKTQEYDLNTEILWFHLSLFDPEPEDDRIPLLERRERMWARVYFGRGEACASLGKTEEARADFEEVRKLDSTRAAEMEARIASLSR